MKAVILAGGLGTRLAEETHLRPKPMVDIGGMPILWHIMKIYSSAGINDFIICAGYKGYMIKEYFANYSLHTSDIELDCVSGTLTYRSRNTEPWRVTIVDTGANSNTGERLRRVKDLIDEEIFCMTYGDGLIDVDIRTLIAYHKSHGKSVTVTAVRPPARFGALEILRDGRVSRFIEKPVGESGYINGGYFVMSKGFFDYLDDPNPVLELRPLADAASDGELFAYQHQGFWHPMDTLRDRQHLDSLLVSGSAPWVKW